MWRDLYDYVYGYLRRQNIPHADAEDLAQDVLVSAFMHMDAVAEGKLHAWLRTVARNKLIDRFRRGAIRPVPIAEIPDAADPSPAPDEIAIASADRQVVLDAMSQLPERDQTIVRLRYLEERSVEETARATRMSPNAAKVALWRARARLRALLGENGGETDE